MASGGPMLPRLTSGGHVLSRGIACGLRGSLVASGGQEEPWGLQISMWDCRWSLLFRAAGGLLGSWVTLVGRAWPLGVKFL